MSIADCYYRRLTCHASGFNNSLATGFNCCCCCVLLLLLLLVRGPSCCWEVWRSWRYHIMSITAWCWGQQILQILLLLLLLLLLVESGCCIYGRR